MKGRGLHQSIAIITGIILFGCATAETEENAVVEPTTPAVITPTMVERDVSPTEYTMSVPDDYATIQTAIEHANVGEVIIVSPGTYTEQINFGGKDLVVRSSDPEDPDVVATTVLECGDDFSIVLFNNGETSDSRLGGFTITNCFQSGIRILDNSSPTIFNNIIEGNEGGDGIVVQDGSSPWIENNTIRNNDEEGIHILDNASPTIVSNIIEGNGTDGISVFNASSWIENNTIRNNDRSGINLLNSSSATIKGNTISDNRVIGVFVTFNSDAMIEDNVISRNSNEVNGGGIAVSLESSATIRDNIINENNAMWGGGLAATVNSSVIVENNEFVENVATEGGGAIAIAADSELSLNDPDDNSYRNNQPDDIFYEE